MPRVATADGRDRIPTDTFSAIITEIYVRDRGLRLVQARFRLRIPHCLVPTSYINYPAHDTFWWNGHSPPLHSPVFDLCCFFISKRLQALLWFWFLQIVIWKLINGLIPIGCTWLFIAHHGQSLDFLNPLQCTMNESIGTGMLGLSIRYMFWGPARQS